MDKSEYALEVHDGEVPETPELAPYVKEGHDGQWYVITVGYRVGIFPFW